MASYVTSSGPPLSFPEPDEVKDELNRILASPVFRGSKRCHDFLHFVVWRVLDGDAGSIKERTIAIEVFGRDVNDSPSDDSIVRVGAREVRKRLAQYYVQDGADDPVRIDLPPGSYVPVFHLVRRSIEHAAPVAPPDPLGLSAVAPVIAEESLAANAVRMRMRRRYSLLPIGALCALCLVSAFLIWRRYNLPASEFEVFWQPIFQSKTPVTVLLANPIVYHPSSRATQLDQQLNGDGDSPVQRPIHLPAKLLDGSDFVPASGDYAALSDVMAALRLDTLFLQHHLQTRIRSAGRVEYNDLVGAGLLLTGAFTNRWTVELTKHNRFQFAYTGPKPSLIDTRTGKRWVLNGKRDNGQSAEDYILLCRLPHSQTRGFVVIGAGINTYGTDEAGRILSEPESLIPLLKKLPPGWADRNLELVLRVEVIGEAPALPEVVAAHTW